MKSTTCEGGVVSYDLNNLNNLRFFRIPFPQRDEILTLHFTCIVTHPNSPHHFSATLPQKT